MRAPKRWITEILKAGAAALLPGGLIVYVAWRLVRHLWAKKERARFAARPLVTRGA
jgi:hypothetical protein